MIFKIETSARDAITYPFRDMEKVLIIGSILLIISFLNKISFSEIYLDILMLAISHVFLFLEIGYGSKIVYKGMQGENKPPEFNRPYILILEGLKKYIILLIFSTIMAFLFRHGTLYFYHENILLAALCFCLFVLVYVSLIGALLNRYENRGKFMKAFYFNEVYSLLKEIGAKDILTILICAFLAQTCVINCFIDFGPSLNILEIVYMIITFFLAPISLISTKRLISLNLRRLYPEKQRI